MNLDAVNLIKDRWMTILPTGIWRFTRPRRSPELEQLRPEQHGQQRLLQQPLRRQLGAQPPQGQKQLGVPP